MLELVDDNCQHLRYRVAYTFHTTVTVMAVGAGGNLSNSETSVNGVRELVAELEAVVDAARAPPEGNRPVDENLSRSHSGELYRCDGIDVCSVADTISDKQDVGVSSRLHRKRVKIVDADGIVGPFWQGQRDGGHQTVCRDNFRAWDFKQLRNHPPNADAYYALSSIRKVRDVPRWQEAVEWQACMPQECMNRER